MAKKEPRGRRAAELLDQAAMVRIDASDDYSIDVSNRLRRLPPYLFGRLNAMKHRLRQAGADIIDLGMGNPRDPTPKPIVEKLCEAVQDPRNHRYSVSTGLFNLRREAARYYQRLWGVELDPESEIVATIGSKEGFSHLCLALLGPGDTALVPSPAFPVHVYAVALAGANVINCPLSEDTDEFLGHIVYALEHIYPRPKVLVLNFPHNPTTMTVELGFYERLRVHHHVEAVQHGGVADRLLLRPPRNGAGAGEDQGLLRLRDLPGAPDRRHHRIPPLRRVRRRAGGGLPAAARLPVPRAGAHRVGREAAEGLHVRLGADPRAVARDGLD
jgi:hypothetical protein